MMHRIITGVTRLVRSVALTAIALSLMAARFAQAQSAVTPPGAGTAVDPYQISQLGHLVWMSDTVGSSSGKYYTVQNDIDASTTAGWNNGEGFAPIGMLYFFDGIFNGNDKVISNLTVKPLGWDGVGLFRMVGSIGVVKNLGLLGVTVRGTEYAGGGNRVGGLVGENHGTVSTCYMMGTVDAIDDVGGLIGYNDGTVSNCQAISSVTGSNFVGGLVGVNDGMVSGCHAAGMVMGGNEVGGLVGVSFEGTVSGCRATGAVTGNSSVGGLVGMHSITLYGCHATGPVKGNCFVGGLVGWNDGTVSNGYATGTVTADTTEGYVYVGGLVGINGGAVRGSYATGPVAGGSGGEGVGGLVGANYAGTVNECYSAGPVTGAGTALGGLVGWNNSGTVTNSYWDTQTSGNASSDGGTGKTTAEMKLQETFAEWDFVNVWSITENLTYPLLSTSTPATPLEIDPVTTNLSSSASSGHLIGVEASVSWTGVSSRSWITITGGDSGTGNGTVTYGVSTNDGGIRSGTIIVSGGGIARTCTVNQAGTTVPYGGIVDSVVAPTNLLPGQAYVVTATVRNTGTNRWTAAISGGNYYPSYRIIVRNMSWENPGNQNISAQMFPIAAGDSHTLSKTVDVSRLPPGRYSYVMEFKYHTTLSSESYAAMKNSPRTNTFTIPGPSPSGGQALATKRPAFTWPATTGATHYYLWINRTGRTYFKQWISGAAGWTPPNDMPVGDYRWWVQAWGPSMGYGTWSGASDFSIIAQVPGALTMTAPNGVQSTNDLTYRWQKDAKATWYRLWVSKAGAGTWHDRWYPMSGTGQASVALAGHPSGLFTWWVQGWSPDGAGPWSSGMTFSTPSADPAKPVLTAPNGSIGGNRPTFQWETAARTTWYRVYVQRGSTPIIDQWTEETSLLAPAALSSGDHAWWIGAWNNVTRKTVWSDRMNFVAP